MQVRSLFLFLMMLPALLLPDGVTIAMCWCAEMRAPVAVKSCCAPSMPVRESCCASMTSREESTEQGRQTLVAPCAGCHQFSLPHEQIQQAEATTHAKFFATAMPFVALARVFFVEPPRVQRSLRWRDTRSPAPPGKSRSLPLLI